MMIRNEAMKAGGDDEVEASTGQRSDSS